ncbi:MAG: ABC transporter substrate-binding protein [Xanthobacteraceae bacterium]|nr:ABC transporter substrate-binding protein [Xanthobacteraceae bacterium]
MFSALLAVFCATGAGAAEVGVSSTAILFGQVAALSGAASALGQGMRRGIEAAFGDANRAGGVHGRQLKLISRDDGYEPDRSVVETRRLIEDDKVFALIGAVGTPTASRTAPMASAANLPFIAPFTGARFLRAPELANVVNIRASYAAEAEAWIKHLTEDLHLTSIAIFYQDDSFGQDSLAGVKQALDRRGLELAAEATYERNTVAVRSALRVLKRAEPQAVVMVGAYRPCAEFIRLARKSGFNPVFVNISFVGATALASELGPDGAGVIVSEVVPFPWDTSIEVVADYHAALRALDAGASPDFVSLEGYLAGRLVVAALRRVGPEPTRQALLAAINDDASFDLGGLTMTFEAGVGIKDPPVFLTVLQSDGSFRPVDRLDPKLFR